MVLSLVYGFYVFFLEGPAKRPHAETTSKLDTFNQFIAKIATMTQDGLSEIDAISSRILALNGPRIRC